MIGWIFDLSPVINGLVHEATRLKMKPMWSGEFGDTALAIFYVTRNGKAGYMLQAADRGGPWTAIVGSAVYEEITAEADTWQAFIKQGGSVAMWNQLERAKKAQSFPELPTA